MATPKMDTFMDLFADLQGLPYNYNTYKHSYAQIKQHGGNCATTISACYVEMGRRFDLDLPYPGGTSEMKPHLRAIQPYRRDGAYLRGAVILNDNFHGPANDLSHVGMKYSNTQFIHCHHSGSATGVTIDNGAEVSNSRWLGGGWPGWSGYEMVGFLPALGADVDPLTLTTLEPHRWYVHPALLACAFATVARVEYDLPGRLPVMCSMQECNQMWWPGPERFDEVYGYSNAVDSDSLGAFQQRPSIKNDDGSPYWGTPQQIIDLDYGLRRFCQEAVKYRSEFDGVTNDDPDGLNDWIQRVQRSATPQAYRKHFERSGQLIEAGWALIPLARRPSEPETIAGPAERGS
ncbi:MAG: hypothetical protein M3305_03995 [Actinomycetota bacterium]|nr:hypothetical protein [Actinomycetota bacterium]